jgi:pimeloyl-ACP methyl ester carboxylesterase
MRPLPSLVLLIHVALVVTPASAQDRFFESNGVRIRYVDQGVGDPLVLVHGYTNAIERNWIETGVLSTLVRDHRVIAFDLRGHGKSDKPHDPKAYGAEMAQDIVRLLDHLHIARAHIVGYSLGGLIPAKLLTTNPDRFVTATLIAASGRRRWTADDQRNAEADATELESGIPYRSVILLTAPRDQPPPTEEAIRQLSRDFLSRNDPLAHAALRRADGGLAISDAQLANVRVPTLAIVGSADSAMNGVKTLKAAWPVLQMVLIDGATHWGERGILLRSESWAPVREFIAAHSAVTRKQ